MNATKYLVSDLCDEIMLLSDEDRHEAIKDSVVMHIEFAAVNAARNQNAVAANSMFILSVDVGRRIKEVLQRNPKPLAHADIIQFRQD